jgi:CDP-4-dehydro-6-deoxyglucose reductase/ferredoxin-NAD(P)+ reductase (naphthalene dioxygenase ferredoxin-specific)
MTMPTIKLQQWPCLLSSRRGTILDAALAAGVPYPHGCRSGECGTCKSKLKAGEVLMDGYHPRVLSRAEREAGLILACRAYPRSNVEVEWLQKNVACAAHPVRELEATVVRAEPVTGSIVRLTLDTHGGPLGFFAGQYAELEFDGCPARPYSMANRPVDPRLEFHVRHVRGGWVSGHVARDAKAGERVKVRGPYGTAFLRQPAQEPIVLIAGGSGLAPMKSILLAALDQRAPGPIHLYHGVRDESDLYDGQALADAAAGKLRYVAVLSLPANPGHTRRGMVHEALREDFRSLSGFKVYLAGPPAMVDAASAAALDLGARSSDLHADAFFAPQPPALERRTGTAARRSKLSPCPSARKSPKAAFP